MQALGEKAVREVIPDATIVRPGTMWGHEDRFLNRIGGKEENKIEQIDVIPTRYIFCSVQLVKDGNTGSIKATQRFALFR